MSKTAQCKEVPGWRKSSYSIANGACVEVATGPEAVLVRDTVSPSGGQLRLPARAWRKFIVGLKRG